MRDGDANEWIEACGCHRGHARQGLTLWTVSVPAAIECDALMLAAIALFDVTAQSSATAHLDGVQHAALGTGH